MDREKLILYPPVVMAHITKNLKDFYSSYIKGKESVNVVFSSQMNGNPHLGTMSTLGVAFSVAEYLSKNFNVESKLKFYALENPPHEKVEREGLVYAKTLDHIIDKDDKVLSEKYLNTFLDLLDGYKKLSGVDYEVIRYKDFQSDPNVRKHAINIIKKEDDFGPILSPTDGHLKYRLNCGQCNFQEKTSKLTRVKEETQDGGLIIESHCLNHDYFQEEFHIDNDTFMDLNTPLRSLIRKADLIDKANLNNSLNVMVDGGDWVHIAGILNYGLSMLGYSQDEQPLRIFAPIIEDWSGAKFSKSLYVKEGAYSGLPKEFISYNDLIDKYGERGLNVLWEEFKSWVQDPKKLFRNYTVDYFKKKLEV